MGLAVRFPANTSTIHAFIDGFTFHIHQFALIQEQRGAVYLPEHPGAADICDTYEVYQLKDVGKTAYGFAPMRPQRTSCTHPIT